jgi:hypothetical protein
MKTHSDDSKPVNLVPPEPKGPLNPNRNDQSASGYPYRWPDYFFPET